MENIRTMSQEELDKVLEEQCADLRANGLKEEEIERVLRRKMAYYQMCRQNGAVEE